MTTVADGSYRSRILGLIGDRNPVESLEGSMAIKDVIDELDGPEFEATVARLFGVDIAGRPKMYSLRGYKLRKVGPVDNTTEPLGGDTYWFGSVEYSIPIIERLRVALFYDIGMVYQDPFSFGTSYHYKDSNGLPQPGTTSMYNDNYGIGFRLNLPIGPLRLDYGIPIQFTNFR